MNQLKTTICNLGLSYKEEDTLIPGFLATTHPDRENDILSVSALHQMKELINGSASGGAVGAYRSVSMAHDWIKQGDPTLDEPAMIVGPVEVVALEDGHHGLKGTIEINPFYRGEMSPEEIKYRIKTGQIAGLSIEYNTDAQNSKKVTMQGKTFRFIEKLTQFGGSALARARMICNPNATWAYKEIEDATKKMEESNMSEQKQETIVAATAAEEKKPEAAPTMAAKETEQKSEAVKLSVKEILGSQEFKEMFNQNLKVESKVRKEDKENEKMTGNALHFKEMNDALGRKEDSVLHFKEAAGRFFEANQEAIAKDMHGHGIPLNSALKVKCSGNQLKIVGKLEFKDTLDTATNPSTYTQSGAEFADVYVPGLVDTFNNQTNFFGALRKVDHIEGGYYYGWTITTSQQTSLSVDPDDNSVNKKPVKKLKLRTDIKEYRLGVDISDYTKFHSRASLGDLFGIEVDKTMRDLMRDLNKDLFTAQVDTTGTKVLGLKAVADSAGNTSIYGLTRSTTNRLAPDTATDTYTASTGQLTKAIVRDAVTKVEIEGAMRDNIVWVVNPKTRDFLLNLEDSKLRYNDGYSSLGFRLKSGFVGQILYDTVPVIVDSQMPVDAMCVVDMESDYIVVSRGPQVIGLAKVGASESAYVSMYIAHVYEQPRRINYLAAVTAPA